jgi:hypothetical protein
MSDTGSSLGRGPAVRRAADAMLRVLGAAHVTLRIPDPSTGDTGSQLGIEPPNFTDVQISPVLVQSLEPEKDGTPQIRVTLSARALQPIADSYGVTAIPDWLLGDVRLVVRDQLLTIRTVMLSEIAGADYLYHIVAST